MNRPAFLKAVGGVTAALAVPVKALAAELPKQWAISPIRWHRMYDIHQDLYLWRADVFIGKSVDETHERITLENAIQIGVDLRSDNKELTEDEKLPAIHVLMDRARFELAKLQVAQWTA